MCEWGVLLRAILRKLGSKDVQGKSTSHGCNDIGGS
jgi:hypothetical protein